PDLRGSPRNAPRGPACRPRRSARRGSADAPRPRARERNDGPALAGLDHRWERRLAAWIVRLLDVEAGENGKVGGAERVGLHRGVEGGAGPDLAMGVRPH